MSIYRSYLNGNHYYTAAWWPIFRYAIPSDTVCSFAYSTFRSLWHAIGGVQLLQQHPLYFLLYRHICTALCLWPLFWLCLQFLRIYTDIEVDGWMDGNIYENGKNLWMVNSTRSALLGRQRQISSEAFKACMYTFVSPFFPFFSLFFFYLVRCVFFFLFLLENFLGFRSYSSRLKNKVMILYVSFDSCVFFWHMRFK